MRNSIVIMAISFIFCSSCTKKFEVTEITHESYKPRIIMSDKEFQKLKADVLGSTLELIFYDNSVAIVDDNGKRIVLDRSKKDDETYYFNVIDDDSHKHKYISLSIRKNKIGYFTSFTFVYAQKSGGWVTAVTPAYSKIRMSCKRKIFSIF